MVQNFYEPFAPPVTQPSTVNVSKIGWLVGWLVGRLKSPFSTKIGYIRDKVLGGDLVLQVKHGQ